MISSNIKHIINLNNSYLKVHCCTNECMNGGTCWTKTNTSLFTCECPYEFSGLKCELSKKIIMKKKSNKGFQKYFIHPIIRYDFEFPELYA